MIKLIRLAEWVVTFLLAGASVVLFTLAFGALFYEPDDESVQEALFVIPLSIILFWAAALVFIGGLHLTTRRVSIFKKVAVACIFILSVLVISLLDSGSGIANTLYIFAAIVLLLHRVFTKKGIETVHEVFE